MVKNTPIVKNQQRFLKSLQIVKMPSNLNILWKCQTCLIK